MVMSAIGVVLHSAITSFSGVRYAYSLASVADCSQKRGQGHTISHLSGADAERKITVTVTGAFKYPENLSSPADRAETGCARRAALSPCRLP